MPTRYTGRPFRGPFRQGLRAISALHIAVYRLSGGRIGGWLTPTAPVLLLTTRGHRSGKNRVTPLVYLVDGADVVVVGSLGGSATAPAWWHNLQAYPAARVQVGRRRWTVRATEATGAERDRLWARLVEIFPGYAAYARATSRPIPVVVLHPQDRSSARPATQGRASSH
jgi:deazaflavin-dependent oxidoreductase (nitroreductase family)